jgi:FKBP-type peptidyl-prolyl cis-trans isomerase FklB
VKIHYRGSFIDGRVFESSYQRGEPAVFPLNRVIPGWIEALQLMKVGDKWQVFIPAYLAYGEMGYNQLVGPNMALVFEIELLGINDK